MLFGASYYHEYQPYERLDADLDLMVAAGFTMIRVGESTWASYEPEDGVISFDALARVVDAAHARGLKVVVGTPTYAIPPWLARAHPEVMAQTSAAGRLPYGARQDVDFTNPTFRRYAERIVRAVAQRFGGHPGVIGFQVDNEIGVHGLRSDELVERFRAHAADRLGGVEGINEKWGLTYWSHRLTTLDDLWAPDGNTNPGYALEWSRFQASLTVEFLEWQRDIVREYIAADQFVFHDQIGGDSAGNTAMREIANALDQVAVNIYLPMQRALQLPEGERAETIGLAPWWLVDAGTSTALWRSDMAYGLRGPRGESFAVAEAQASSIGDQATSVPPFPGQLRLMAHLFASRGADLLAYWHWHTLHYGNETYWGGVLGHDLEPNRVYAEVASIGAELRRVSPELEGLVPDADVAFLYSRDSLRALDFMPALLTPGTDRPDPHGYHRAFMGLYQGALDSGMQARILHPDSDWSAQAVLVVPTLYIADDALLDKLIAHAESGAHVVLTFRAGYADEWARVRWTRAPGVLREPSGISYQEYTTLISPVPLVAHAVEGLPALDLGTTPIATAWADLLVPEGAEVLAGYDDPFLGDYAAVTTKAVGRGRITWIGTKPGRDASAALIRWALAERDQAPVADAWTVPPQVRVSSGQRPDGVRVWAVANHSWEPVTIPCPASLIDVTEGGPAGSELVLAAWDSRLLLESRR